jgi:flagellin
MALTINTNVGAMVALQNLTANNEQLAKTQNRVSTGLTNASTKDDSASFVIAQKLRGDILGLKAVDNSLNRAKSVTDVAVAGAEEISDLVNKMASKAQESVDAIDAKSRAALNRDFKAYRDTIATIVKSADFNGTNLLRAGGGDVTALLTIQDGNTATPGYETDSLSVTNLGLDLGGATITVTATDEMTDVATSTAVMDKLNATKDLLAVKLSELGSASRRISTQISFNSKLTDTIVSGIGNLVDADMAKESASLQALQVKQQLGVQALSIANQSPQTILSLFR